MTRLELLLVVQNAIENATMMVPDCHTFTFSRGKYKEELERNGCGGGNFLMALGLFTVVGYLSCLYWILDGKPFNQPSEVSVTDRNDVSAEIAFSKLIRDLPADINMGILANEASSIWKFFRNKLAHIGVPLQAVRTFSPDQPSEDFIEIVRRGRRPVFLRDGEGWICEVDHFAFRVEEIKQWLLTRLEGGDFSDDDFARAFAWILRTGESPIV